MTHTRLRLIGLGLTVAVGLSVLACSQTSTNSALSSTAGQLFCAIQTAGGGTIVAGLINAEATAVSPAAAPIAVLATGATVNFVNNACTQAAQNTGAKAAIPVSPPASPATAPTIAVKPSLVTS